MTLGLRLHPSPGAAREEGWPGARGELAGRLRSRGPGGRISERKTQGQQSAPKKPAFQLPRLLREPSRVLGRLRFTARLRPRGKVARRSEGSPLPLANPTTRPSPAFHGPGPRGGGELSREEERSAPPRPGQTRAGSAAPPPAPRRPARAAGPLRPRIMHGSEVPSALPPLEDAIYVGGGRGPGGQEGVADGRTAARPGRRPERPLESRRARLPRGGQTRPKALEQSLCTPGGTRTGRERGTDRRGGPRSGHEVARVSAHFPYEVGGEGREGRVPAAPSPLPELCTTRRGEGHCVSGLGREGRLMDPNLGGRPGGRGLSPPPVWQEALRPRPLPRGRGWFAGGGHRRGEGRGLGWGWGSRWRSGEAARGVLGFVTVRTRGKLRSW